MKQFTSLMQEQTLNGMIGHRFRKNAVTGKPETGDADEEENTSLLSDEMSVLVGAQCLYRTIRKLHICMGILALTTLCILIASLAEKWYGDSRHARAALEAVTVVFFFCVIIMYQMRNEVPINIIMLLIVNGLSCLSLGIVCGLEMCD